MTIKYLRIGEVAKRLNKTTTTIRRWEREGIITAMRTPTGHRLFAETEINRILGIPELDPNISDQRKVAIYTRVSTRKQQQAGNLRRQTERLVAYATEKQYQIQLNVQDLGSGLNEKRRGLKRILQAIQQQEIDLILIEYKDRLARFGYRYLEQFANSYGIGIEVIADQPKKELQTELVEDLLAIVTSFAARLYGHRSQRFQKLKHCVSQNTESSPNDSKSEELLNSNQLK